MLATTYGLVSHADGGSAPDSSPANVRTAVEGSLQRPRTDHIDLLHQHRVDPDTPIEETIGAAAELVAEGKVRYLGLSEALGEPTDTFEHLIEEMMQAIHPRLRS